MGKLSERILFGQYIINKGFASYSQLSEAIKLQESECSNMKLGEILYSRFNVFENEEQLQKVVDEFYGMRNSIINEREKEKEKYTASTMVEDVTFYLSQYANTLDLDFLKKAILLIKGEVEYRKKRNI